jgi:hypothetical protein
MGGKIFKGLTRDANQDDKKKVNQFILNLGFRGSDFKFIGSSNSANPNAKFGDIDVALYSDHEISQLLGLFVKSGYKIETHGNTIFLCFQDVQVDINIISQKNIYDDWVKEATTVSSNDPFKALYRNELLFHLVNIVHNPVILSMDRTKVNTFQRVRYTLFEGLIKSTYTYKSEATGKYLVNPVKILDEPFILGHSFKNFRDSIIPERYSQENGYRMDSIDILKNMDKRFSLKSCAFVLEETIKGLERKNVQIPNIFYTKYEEFKSQ